MKANHENLENSTGVNALSGKLLAKNTIINLFGQILPMIVAVVTIPFIIRGLGTERFGVLTLAWMVVGYFSLFDMGLGRATTKFVAEYLGQDKNEDIGKLVWASLCMLSVFGLIGTCIALFIVPWLVGSVLNIPDALLGESMNAFYLLAFSIPVVSLSAGARGVLEARQRFDQVNLIKIPIYTAAFVSPLIVLPFSKSLVPIVAVLIASRLAGLIAYLGLALSSLPGLKRFSFPGYKIVKQLLSYGGWLTVSNIVWPFMTYMDRFIIGAMLTMSAVAYYVTPYELVSKLLIITGGVLGVVFPAFSMYAAGAFEKLHALFNTTIKYLLLILVPIVFVFIALSWPLLQVWLGSEFARNSALILQLLALGKLINSVSQVPSSAIQAMGRPDITAKLHLIELPLYLGMLWMFIHSMGIVGAAMAWVLRVIFDSTLYFIIYYRLNPEPGKKRPALNMKVVYWAALMMVCAFLTAGLYGLPIQITVSVSVLAISALLYWRVFLDQSEKGYIVSLLTGMFRRHRPIEPEGVVDSPQYYNEKAGV